MAAWAADLEKARKEFITGNYSNSIRLSEQGLRENEYGEEWRLLLAQSLVTAGRYPEALAVITNSLPRYATSVRLRLVGHEVFLHNGQPARARELIDEINQLAGQRPWAYRDATNLVTLGKAALLLGADPRRVLERMFDQAKKTDPNCLEAYVASGEVALDKHDYELAAKIFQEGLKKFPDDADLHLGLAKAYTPSDRPQMVRSLQTALKQNTNHVASLLWLADHLIDSEEYNEAEKLLARTLTVNPWQPEAWSYRAVLKHLSGDAQGEATSRETALRFWKSNPRVDYLIGQKLSQKYRFAEGAACQRKALKFDANYSAAKIQLAQDLLRLGQEEEGWRLADEVNQNDAYDVTAYNLVTLKDSLTRFQTITNTDFIVRIARNEAAIYGQKVLALLERAKTNLCEKYGFKLDQPTIVEIFPEQKDFAVRTFGMPGNPGYLGVCFGSVITANSPAAQAAHPANWEAVLWHEFCHVVTLQMTRNKMPRWLSEGISVHEEMEANPAWGQTMNPRYREMVLSGDLTPVGKLSAAFLAPKTPQHLQFAYYESSLVVGFLVKQFGQEALQQILRDLGAGVEINQAIASHTAPLEKIEKDFAAFARQRAEQLAPGLSWEKTKPDGLKNLPEDLQFDWTGQSTSNYWALTQKAKNLITEKKWEDAKAPLKKLIELYPGQAGPDNAYALLAEAHRGLNETEPEEAALSKLAALSADSTDAYLRLMELAAAKKDWPAVLQNANRFLAVNPLLPQPHRYLAQASEALGKTGQAIESYQVLLNLDPPDPAEVHFRLAQLLHQAGDVSARRHALQALEEAPRFRAAHRLLLELTGELPSNKTNGAAINQEKK